MREPSGLRCAGERQPRLGRAAGEPAFRRNRRRGGRECDELLAIGDERRNRRRGGRECDELLAIGENVAIVGAGDTIATKRWSANVGFVATIARPRTIATKPTPRDGNVATIARPRTIATKPT